MPQMKGKWSDVAGERMNRMHEPNKAAYVDDVGTTYNERTQMPIICQPKIIFMY